MNGSRIMLFLVALMWFGTVPVHPGTTIANSVEAAKVRLARVNIAVLVTRLEEYYLLHGRYPASLADLVAGGLVENVPGALVDPWGNGYQYTVPGNHDPGSPYELGSHGPDGVADTGDDIRSGMPR